MKLNEINPHIRFAYEFDYVPGQMNSYRAYDCHLYYITSDTSSISIADKSYELLRDTSVFVPPGVEYRFGKDVSFSTVSINFDMTQSRSDLERPIDPVPSELFSEDKITERVELADCDMFSLPFVMYGMGYLLDRIKKILAEFEAKQQCFREMSSAYLKDTLIELVRACRHGGRSFQKINELINYVNEHYREPLTNQSLAAMIGYHPYHVNRLVRASLGMTLHHYVILRRIEAAKKLLRETYMSVNEIAEACGYNSFTNFSTDFKKRTGMSPHRFRERARLLI